MKRIIKFRQYLTDKKIMLSWEELINQEHEDSETLEATLTEKFSNASEPMQFTGLTDKNGKEIYEGDILRVRMNPEQNMIEPVEYRESSYCCGDYGLCAVDHESVIIGNVFQNPELLKGEK